MRKKILFTFFILFIMCFAVNNKAEVFAGTLMQREGDYYINSRYVYCALGAGRAGLTQYTADKIKTITLLANTNIPSDAISSWDVSDSRDGSIMAWIKTNISDRSMYDLYISALYENKIVAPANAYSLFDNYWNCAEINGLEILDTSNVTNMIRMFNGCSKLTNIDLSAFNTSNVTNMFRMFDGCRSLTNIDLKTFDTSKVVYMNFMFDGCSSLTNIDLSAFNTSNVTRMDQMFAYCSSLTNIDLSAFNTSNVTTMYGMFFTCCKLTNIDLKTFDTSNVTDMTYMFNGCSSLTNIDLSMFNTSNVTDMSGMFNYCHLLTNIDLSSFDTSKVVYMNSMFAHCRSLTNIDLSTFNTSNVTNMGSMFGSCSSLTNIDLSMFDTSNVSNMSWMFNDCKLLTNIDLSSFDTSNLTTMSNMFNGCNLLNTIILGEGFTKLSGSSMFYNTALTSLILKKPVATTSEVVALSTGTYLETTNSNKAVVYVPDTTAEAAYESATNWSTLLGADRIEPILKLSGSNPMSVDKGSSYIEPGVTVAGFSSESSTEKINYEQYGYSVTKSGIVDTNVVETYTITYILKNKSGEIVDSVSRKVTIKSDTSAPRITAFNIEKKIDGKYINSSIATINIEAEDDEGVEEVLLSNTLLSTEEVRKKVSGTILGDWVPYTNKLLWAFPIGDKEVNVYAWVKDGAGNISKYATDSAKLFSEYIGNNRK